jgi:hypothetical protein
MSSEAHRYFDLAHFLLYGALLIGVPIFAWLRGGAAERYGATLYCLSVVTSILLEMAMGQKMPVAPEFLLDALVAFGFLALAIRYNSLWIGATLILKGVQLGLHAIHLTDASDARIAGVNVYAEALNLLAIAMLLSILGGALSSARARRRAAAEKTPPETSGRLISPELQLR